MFPWAPALRRIGLQFYRWPHPRKMEAPALTQLLRDALGGTSNDEWEWAKEVVGKYGITSHVTHPDVYGFLAELPDFLWHNELPVGSTSQFAQWSVFRLAKEHGVTVLLDGQGADELLGGYEQYFSAYLAALGDPDAGTNYARSQRNSHQIPPGLVVADAVDRPSPSW